MALLTPNDIRSLAATAGVRPTKRLGQNFVHDAGTVRRIVRTAAINPGDVVLEVGPGLGSLTLALLEAGAHVVAVEIDPVLAELLPGTVARFLPEATDRLAVLTADALKIQSPQSLPVPESLAGNPATPTKLVANLPYNVATPVILTLLAVLPEIREVLVMVQSEVADRLVAGPGTRVYGGPSVKVAWYGKATHAGMVSRSVFWPVPNVDSALVRIVRGTPPKLAPGVGRADVFAVVDDAFAQRRKTLRAALANWAGSPGAAEAALRAAGVDPVRRGETLTVEDFCAVAEQGNRTTLGPDQRAPHAGGLAARADQLAPEANQ